MTDRQASFDDIPEPQPSLRERLGLSDESEESEPCPACDDSGLMEATSGGRVPCVFCDAIPEGDDDVEE